MAGWHCQIKHYWSTLVEYLKDPKILWHWIDPYLSFSSFQNCSHFPTAFCGVKLLCVVSSLVKTVTPRSLSASAWTSWSNWSAMSSVRWSCSICSQVLMTSISGSHFPGLLCYSSWEASMPAKKFATKIKQLSITPARPYTSGIVGTFMCRI